MPLALLIRDIVFPGVWAYAFVAGEVSWRGNAMKIKTDGEDELNAAPAPMPTAMTRSDGRP
jgi:ceramide glucosyltransferase